MSEMDNVLTVNVRVQFFNELTEQQKMELCSKCSRAVYKVVHDFKMEILEDATV